MFIWPTRKRDHVSCMIFEFSSFLEMLTSRGGGGGGGATGVKWSCIYFIILLTVIYFINSSE